MKMFNKKFSQPGSAPGVLIAPGGPAREAQIRVLHYTNEAVEEKDIDSVGDVFPCVDLPGVTWIDVSGLYWW